MHISSLSTIEGVPFSALANKGGGRALSTNEASWIRIRYAISSPDSTSYSPDAISGSLKRNIDILTASNRLGRLVRMASQRSRPLAQISQVRMQYRNVVLMLLGSDQADIIRTYEHNILAP